ncbi:hypothetical protein [Arthrobacter sp. A2-55]|uniref:hypothetical protein n=1 Tax=Arthrobacter sp. A2-55 TaxID=2897337 RepID=UPI0021CD8938|nr:hypothetical protein [Arthrobacter sp. A2-55]MCU6480467.1 hypothetical protein [Arthrobacter sp. A2-55]
MTLEIMPEVDQLTDACRTRFGDESRWITAEGYRDSLALCIIDSLFSTGSHYQSVINVVNNYCSHRIGQGGKPEHDGTKELIGTYTDIGGSDKWADLVNNRKPAHTHPGALLKAEVIYRAAEKLHAMGIKTMADLYVAHAADEHLTELKTAWRKLPSQSSGVTFNYFLILAGFQSVKPDRMVLRFVEEHVGGGRTLTPMQTADLIKAVAQAYPTTPSKLDHIIWRYVSGRDILAPENEPES